MEASETFIVTAGDTARHLGSGSLDVLGTPRLLAWCEAVTCTAIADTLTPATTSVGTRVAFELDPGHRRPVPFGQALEPEPAVQAVRPCHLGQRRQHHRRVACGSRQRDAVPSQCLTDAVSLRGRGDREHPELALTRSTDLSPG